MSVKTKASVGAVPPARLVLQYNREGNSVTLFNDDSGTWVGVFTCTNHAIQFARKVLGYTGGL